VHPPRRPYTGVSEEDHDVINATDGGDPVSNGHRSLEEKKAFTEVACL